MTNLEYWNKVQEIIDHSRNQADSVFGKDTPFRVEFRYSGGTKHYQYFTDVESASSALDHLVTYGPTGRALLERPTSQKIQVRGLRGGWNPYKINA